MREAVGEPRRKIPYAGKPKSKAGKKRPPKTSSMPPAEVVDAYSEHPTGFEGDDPFFDYAFWLEPHQLRSKALRTVVEANRTGDWQHVARVFCNPARRSMVGSR